MTSYSRGGTLTFEPTGMLTYQSGDAVDLPDLPGPADDGTVFDAAQRLLDAIRREALSSGIALPERQVISVGGTIVDCEQVAVTISQSDPYPPLDGMTPCANVRWGHRLSAHIARKSCALPQTRGRTQHAPTPDDLIREARIVSDDAALMQRVAAAPGEMHPETNVLMAKAGDMHVVELNVVVSGDATREW